MSLRIVGQHKGPVDLDLERATVLDLKKAVSRASGLALSGLKLLAGGKHLKDNAAVLKQCGVTAGQKIIVLRQDLSTQVQAEEGLTRRTEEVAQAASLLSARAARDIGAGGRGNAWGNWDRGQARGRGRGRGRGGRGGGRRDGLPQIELTNQDGEAMAIPQEDSAALMEGIMLHRQGLACVKRMGVPTPVAIAGPNPWADMTRPNDKLNPKAPLSKSADSADGKASDAGAGSEGGGPDENPHASPGNARDVGVEEHKNAEPPDGDTCGAISRDSIEAETACNGDRTGLERPNMTAPSAAGKSSDGDSNAEVAESEGDPDSALQATETYAGDKISADKGKGKAKCGTPTGPGRTGRCPSTSEKRLAQREALGLLMRADEAFRRCNPAYLEMVDNYAYLCLDIVWLLFLMKDMSNLDLASSKLASVEKGFRKAHGQGLQRLTALKGEYCAEKLLYVRLHLLQGVVAFLQGESGKASGLLIRAKEEAKALRPSPALAKRLMQQWRTMKFETLQPTMAFRALRVGRNDLNAAWQYLEGLRTRQDLVKVERERRKEQRRAERYGLTADKKGFVAAGLVDQLVGGGFTRTKAVRALRQHDNDVEAALTSLTSEAASGSSQRSNDESLAVLQSLGVSSDTARDTLARTGQLGDALRELGIDVPEGITTGIAGSGFGGEGSNILDSIVGAGRGNQEASKDGGGGESEEEKDQEETGPTEEEMRLYDALAGDRNNEDEEGYLDVALEDEADAAEMYLHLCKGNIPVTFDLAKVRAGIDEATAEAV